MSTRLFTTARAYPTSSCTVICLGVSLLLAGITSVRHAEPFTTVADGSVKVKREGLDKHTAVSPQLLGAAAREYLKQPGEGQSLMQAITSARFGLKKQDHGPKGETDAGYLGLSHVQNLNAWFGREVVTVRPTNAQEKSESAWQLDMRLKSFGYGNDLIAAPPIVSQHVKDNRIEYERDEDCRLPIANCRFEDALFQSTLGNRKSTIAEWYENRAEGIEQGFTLYERLHHNNDLLSDPLHLVVQLNGGLRAKVNKYGQAIELIDSRDKPVLSYGQLTAVDAKGRHLSSHMETSNEGSEIVLVVDDHDAAYPIVIDPIVATLEKILDAGNRSQSGGQFGDAVAIDGDTAVVGSWLEDSPGALDTGAIYWFVRTGSTWTSAAGTPPGQFPARAECGYSVATRGGRVVFGCPGISSNTGKAFLLSLSALTLTELTPGDLPAGSFLGASVAINFFGIVVGAPNCPVGGKTNAGRAYQFDLQGGSQGAIELIVPVQNGNLGSGLAMSDSDNTVLLGMPGTNQVFDSERPNALQANDSSPGDSFGQTLARSGNTVVISAPGDDDKGTDSGAAYVFVLDASGNWTQQQKLTASDGKANDQFSYFSVAIEGNTIVVGARRQDLTSSNPNDNSGAAYIFTRNGTVWTQQRKLSAGGFFRAPGDEFGTGVGVSNDTVIVSAPLETAPNGTSNAGAIYVYRLDCVPPRKTFAISELTDASDDEAPNKTYCPGQNVTLSVGLSNGNVSSFSYQWRKNGVNIPGATSFFYRLTNVSASDAGSYDVLVSNSCGGEFSLPATIALHTFALNPTSQNFGASGSNGVVNVTSTGSCGWTVTSNSSFITVTSGATGSGNGSVNFSVAANPTSSQRTGSITIAGKTFNVTQDGSTTQSSVVQFNASNYSVTEDCTFVTITVNRVGDSSGAASVDYATSDVTASERRDYTTALGTLRFAAGETSKTFVVLISEDSYGEGLETFNVNLSNPSGVSLGTSVATVQIIDDPTEPSVNAIDDAQTFVGQHYHDFLNRQSDPSGLNFWTSQITSCGTDQSCIQLKRLNVSAAYFLSIEFQQTGYLVERLYKTAYGDASGTSTLNGPHQLPVPIVRFTEFLRDTQRIGQGIVVGQTGWEAALENNKVAFTAEFVQLSRFISAYPAAMTAAQFVDKLNTNAGSPLSLAERNQLTNDLSINSKTRAQVLRSIAEHSNLVTSESNRAFVLMQYFGYLRRNPNDAPDNDYTGYDFWLTKLNQFSGNFVDAEMVKAFITSTEYRLRFGQS